MDSEDISVDPVAKAAKTEDLVAPTPMDTEKREERAGLYLASLFMLALPLLIVAAITLPSTSPFRSEDTSSTGTGLDRLEITGQEVETVDGEIADVEVAGQTERSGNEDDSGSVDDGQTGTTELDAEAEDAGEGEDGERSTSPTISDEDSEDADGVANTDNEAVNSDGVVDEGVSDAGASTDGTDATQTADTTTEEITTTSTRAVPSATAAQRQTTTTTVKSIIPTVRITATTINPTTTTVKPTTTTSRPKATTSTTSTTSTTTTTTTTTTTQAPKVEPVEFAQRIDIGRIGETSLNFRFSSVTTSPYVVTVRSGSTVVSTKSGTANAGSLVNETVQGLSAGTAYTVQVTLNGPPVATSPQVAFQTSGGAPEPSETSVSIGGVEVVDVRSNRFQVNYTSNICANGSFVIREQGGGTVGSNAGQAAGCTTRHLAIPGFWTASLKPNTTYVITLTVEANGAGRGDGNTASTSVTVTTGS